MGLFDWGSSETQPTSTSTSSAALPDYAEPYYTDLLSRTQANMDTAYTPYSGQRIAGFGEQTTAGFDAMRDVATAGTPQEFTQASNTYGDIAGQADMQQQGLYDPTADIGLYDAPSYVASQQGLGSYSDPGVANQYMDPYVTNVLDTQQQRLTQRYDEDQLRRNDAAIGAGAFGNNRLGVENGIANRELSLQRNEVDARGLSQAYQTGAGIYDQERAAMLQDRGMHYGVEGANRDRNLAWQQSAYGVQNANRNALLANQRLNTDIFGANADRSLRQGDQRLQGATGLLGTGDAIRQQQMNDATTLTGIGGAYDDLYQSSLDTGYNDFTNQRDYERNQLNFYSGILRGVPVSPTQESVRYDAGPSSTSQLLGLTTAGLGLAGSYYNNQNRAGLD